MYWDLQQNSMQLQAFHYGHRELIRQFHLDSMVVLSNLNHIDDHVQEVLWRFSQLQHKFLMNEDEIDHVLEISTTKELFDMAFFYRRRIISL
jgi:hypothetical protein